MLNCHFASFEPLKVAALPCRKYITVAEPPYLSTLAFTPSCEWCSRSGCGGCLRNGVHVSHISINNKLLTATDWLRPPCRMYLTMGDAATWCPMRARACRSHIKPIKVT